MLSQAPLMSDPSRWRTMMYEAFWLGEEPTLTAEERKHQQQRQADDARRAIGAPVGKGKLAEMDALLARAALLRGEQADK
jgi:hypothetical protein